MEIKLCYKSYPVKMSLEACKSFTDKTGLDLQTVLQDYIAACEAVTATTVIGKCAEFAKIHPRSIACEALHSLINGACDGVSLDEIQDATYRVSWPLSNRPDDLSEPWPIVMIEMAVQINKYFNENVPVKKPTTSAA